MFRRTCLTLVVLSAILVGAGYLAGAAQATPSGMVAPKPLPSSTGTDPASGDATSPLAPVIYKFRPFSGAVGRGVTIRGIDLSNATAISFNGTPAIIIKDKDKRIRTMVPPGARTGPIRVTTTGGTVATAESFTVIQAPGS